MGIPLFSLMRKRAASCAAGSPATMPEAVQNASCSTTGGKDATVLPEENGPWNRNRGDVPEPSPSCDAGGSGNEAGETRQPEPTVGNIPSSLHRLAALDTNIAALVGWGLVPHLEGGALVLAGLESLDAESRDGVTRWLDRRNNNGEPRSERVARALRTGRRCSC